MFTCPSTPSTQLSELTQKESQDALTSLLMRLRVDPPAVAVGTRSDELHDAGLDTMEVSPNIDLPQDPSPPRPPQAKQKEQKGFRLSRLRELLGLGR